MYFRSEKARGTEHAVRSKAVLGDVERAKARPPASLEKPTEGGMDNMDIHAKKKNKSVVDVEMKSSLKREECIFATN